MILSRRHPLQRRGDPLGDLIRRQGVRQPLVGSGLGRAVRTKKVNLPARLQPGLRRGRDACKLFVETSAGAGLRIERRQQRGAAGHLRGPGLRNAGLGLRHTGADGRGRVDLLHKQRVAQLRPLGEGRAELLSPMGTVVASPDAATIGSKRDDATTRAILAATAEDKLYTDFNADAQGLVKVYAPLRVGESNRRFALGVLVPRALLTTQARSQLLLVVLIGLLAAVALCAGLYLVLRQLVLRPLAEIAPDAVHPLERRTIGELWRAHPAHGEHFDAVFLDAPA